MIDAAVVFDFDGVIVETEEPTFLAWRDVWASYGQDLELAEWAGCIGTSQGASTFAPFDELVRRSGRPLMEGVVRAEVRRRAASVLARMPIADGVLGWLDDAEAGGIGVAIASSSPRSWIDGHLARLGLDRRLSVVACYDDCGVTKPDPTVYLLACHRLGVAPARALAVEDSAHGIAAARRAGLAVVAVPTPMTAHMDFRAADLIVGSLDEVTLPAALALLDRDHRE